MTRDTGFGCGESPWLFVIMINIFICIVLILIVRTFVVSVKKFIFNRPVLEKGEIVDVRLKLLCVVTLFLYVSESIAIAIALNIGLICPSQAKYTGSYVAMVKSVVYLYPLPLALQYLIFAIRFIMAFENSILFINHITKYTMYFLSFLQLLVYFIFILVTILIPLDYADFQTFFKIIGPIFVFIYISSFILLLKTFQKQIRLCLQTVFADSVELQLELINLAIKQLCCVIVSLLSTLTLCILFICVINVLHEVGSDALEAGYGFLLPLNNVDVLINMNCLVLQWLYFDKLYHKWCNKCDNCVKKIYQTKLGPLDDFKRQQLVVNVLPSPHTRTCISPTLNTASMSRTSTGYCSDGTDKNDNE